MTEPYVFSNVIYIYVASDRGKLVKIELQSAVFTPVVVVFCRNEHRLFRS